MSGRTIWLAKDADWHLREWLVDLGETFGPAGPLAVDWLECAAKRQNNGGRVKAGIKSLARGVYSDVDTVGEILSRSVTLGLLLEYEEESGLFKARISWWGADQDKALAASRKAKQRAAATETQAGVDGVSEHVLPAEQTAPRKEDEAKTRSRVAAQREREEASQHPPADFPDELLPHLREVFKVLRDLAERHGAKRVSVLALGQVVMARPQKPLVKAAHDYAAWADDKAQQRKDVVAGYRNWLDRTDDLAGVERLSESGAPASGPTLRVVSSEPGKYDRAAGLS